MIFSMELKKYKERNKKKIGIVLFTVLCIFLIAGVILYKSFALFEVNTNQNVINGSVEEMGDFTLAYYIDDVISLNPVSFL